MKKLFFLSLVASFFLGIHAVQASNIENLHAIYTTDNKVFLEWDHLPDTLLYDTDGYVVQFSMYENKVRNVDPGILFLNAKQNSVSLRGADFERDTWYYFRVYTYVQEGRSRILTNGSKVLKWKYLPNDETESELIEANDPIISNENADLGVEFGKLRVVRYDTYATFSWSRPNLAKSDADGVIIVLKKSGSADTLVELSAGLDITSGKITGLTPETAYEAKGYFYKTVGGEDQKFGAGTAEKFTTQKAYSAAEKARIDRLRQRGLIKDSALTTVNVSGTSTTTSPDTSTSSTSSTSTSTTSTSSTSTSETYSRAQIEKKIADLEKELQSWKLKLKSLGTSSNSRSNTTSSTSKQTTSTPKESLRERMCRILKRNCK